MVKKNFKKNVTSESNDSKLVDLIIKHSSRFLYIIVSASLLFFVSARLFSSRSTKAKKAYLEADNLFEKFKSSVSSNKPEESAKDFKALEALLVKYPVLHTKYDNDISQGFVIQGDAEQAEEFSEISSKRNANLVNPLFREYSLNTIIIGKRNYEEALENAILLKDKLLQASELNGSREFGKVLFGFNLLRIFSLEQELGRSEEEEGALQEFKEWSSENSQEYKQLVKIFNAGKRSFDNYIKSRETFLTDKIGVKKTSSDYEEGASLD